MAPFRRPARGAGAAGGVAFFDRYQGKGVPDGTVSLSVRLTFQAPDRTLTDAEVQQSVDPILAALVAREHNADPVGEDSVISSSIEDD